MVGFKAKLVLRGRSRALFGCVRFAISIRQPSGNVDQATGGKCLEIKI